MDKLPLYSLMVIDDFTFWKDMLSNDRCTPTFLQKLEILTSQDELSAVRLAISYSNLSIAQVESILDKLNDVTLLSDIPKDKASYINTEVKRLLLTSQTSELEQLYHNILHSRVYNSNLDKKDSN